MTNLYSRTNEEAFDILFGSRIKRVVKKNPKKKEKRKNQRKRGEKKRSKVIRWDGDTHTHTNTHGRGINSTQLNSTQQ